MYLDIYFLVYYLVWYQNLKKITFKFSTAQYVMLLRLSKILVLNLNISKMYNTKIKMSIQFLETKKYLIFTFKIH